MPWRGSGRRVRVTWRACGRVRGSGSVTRGGTSLVFFMLASASHLVRAPLLYSQESFNNDSRQTALAPKLAALAAWQERVLSNALVARVRLHTGASPSMSVPGVPTANQFIQQQPRQQRHGGMPPQQRPNPMHAPMGAPSHMQMQPQLSQLSQPGQPSASMSNGMQHPQQQQHVRQQQGQQQQPRYGMAGTSQAMVAPPQHYSQPMVMQHQIPPGHAPGRPMMHPGMFNTSGPIRMPHRQYSLDNKIDLHPAAQAASRKNR